MPNQYTSQRISLVCHECGAVFTVKASKSESARFCSDICRTTASRKPKHPKPCERCGTSFQPVGRGLGPMKRRFCGPACAAAARNEARTKTIEERFWAKVQKTDDCWMWTGATRHGYGEISKGGKSTEIFVASRFSYELHFGPIPDGFLVCHRCDNPPCVRPDHLFLGTHVENTSDMLSKGRGKYGPRR